MFEFQVFCVTLLLLVTCFALLGVLSTLVYTAFRKLGQTLCRLAGMIK